MRTLAGFGLLAGFVWMASRIIRHEHEQAHTVVDPFDFEPEYVEERCGALSYTENFRWACTLPPHPNRPNEHYNKRVARI